METVEINTEYIKLGQLLKLANMVGQGSDVKALIAEEMVFVNGEPCIQRGKKIYDGFIVELKGGGKVQVVSKVE